MVIVLKVQNLPGVDVGLALLALAELVPLGLHPLGDVAPLEGFLAGGGVFGRVGAVLLRDASALSHDLFVLGSGGVEARGAYLPTLQFGSGPIGGGGVLCQSISAIGQRVLKVYALVGFGDDGLSDSSLLLAGDLAHAHDVLVCTAGDFAKVGCAAALL